MMAYIEAYDEGKSIIKIVDGAGRVVEKFEVDAIKVEMSAGWVKPAGSPVPFRFEVFRN
ncbi:MAG: hypothetical protein ACE14T_10125 [Syntrophales bacterium]